MANLSAEGDAEFLYAAGDWVEEPWSTWLPLMITADYWQYYEASDLNSASLRDSWSDHAQFFSKRYFCTSCPRRGPLLPHQLLPDHESHATIGVTRVGNFTGVLYNELKGFLDVSDIKRNYWHDGQSYLQLRSLVRPDRRVRSPDEITCFHCEIIQTVDGGTILTIYCSVECQFSSRLSRDAAILFALMVPDETSLRKFRHDKDYSFIKLSTDAQVPKRSKSSSMVIDENDRPTGRPPRATPDVVQQDVQFPIFASPSSSDCPTPIQDMGVSPLRTPNQL